MFKDFFAELIVMAGRCAGSRGTGELVSNED